MEILQQLGQLFLQAVPTVVIVFIFYLFLRWAFFAPIEKAMAERAARIEGAQAEAARVEAAAKEESDAYNAALKKARAQIFVEQEHARQHVLDERSRLLKAMRARAQEEVEATKKRIADDISAARPEIERQTPGLADQIARAILERPIQLGGGPAQ